MLLSALMTAFTVSLAAFSYISFAWFSANRQASVNFSSLTVSGGLTVSVDYCKLNVNGGASGATVSNGYMMKNAQSLVESNLSSTYTYANLFASADTDQCSTQWMAPLYASTYAIKVTNPANNNPTKPVLYLEGFTSPSSTTDALATGTGTQADPYVLSDYLSLNKALRVYCEWTTTPDTALQAFLTKTFDDTSVTDGTYDTTGDVFINTAVSSNKYAINAGAATSGVVSANDLWATGTTLASDSIGYFLITIYFSNDSSTFYNKVGTTTVDSKTVNLYQASTSGDSNAYQSITGFAFTDLLINPE